MTLTVEQLANGLAPEKDLVFPACPADPEMRERLAELGAEPVGGTPAEFADLIATETTKWAKVVEDAGVKLE